MSKLQRNPSTGKLMRNRVTGKLMRAITPVYGDNCENCPIPPETPYQVAVTFSGIIVCTECTRYHIGGYVYAKWSFLFDPNNTWVLTQKGNNACAWGRIIEDAIHVRRYLDGVCSEEYFYDEFDMDVRIWIANGVPGAVLTMTTYVPPPEPESFNSLFYCPAYSPASGCLNKSGLSNINTCGNNYIVSDSGTAVVVEV
ncbi:MAG: hypothetical protein KAY65_12915 [Planctomycetes bacterium]|nr:hypothetical protein [Planctomycetota bacterium]